MLFNSVGLSRCGPVGVSTHCGYLWIAARVQDALSTEAVRPEALHVFGTGNPLPRFI